MATERSDKLYEAARDSQQKFDYFLLGVIGALCAYIGQSFRPEPLGFNPSSLELCAVLVLFSSGIAGFKRIENTNRVIKINAGYLHFQERRGAIASTSGAPFLNTATGQGYSRTDAEAEMHALTDLISKARRDLDEAGEKSLASYNWRNWLLILGFLTLIGSRVWGSYV